MDPLTLFLLSQAPTVLSMFSQGPSAPPPVQMPTLPDRSRWQDQLLQSAFNPNDALALMGRDRMLEGINRQMINRGLGQSSISNQTMASALAELEAQNLANEVQRRSSALGTVGGMDLNAANLAMNAANARNQDAWSRYQNEAQGRQGFWGGLQGMANAGLGVYGRQQQMDQLQQMMDQNKNYFTQMFPSGGAYAPPPGLSMPNMSQFGYK